MSNINSNASALLHFVKYCYEHSCLEYLVKDMFGCERIGNRTLKAMTKLGAIDLTNVSDSDLPRGLKKALITKGVNGMNGGLFVDNEGNVYVITARTNNLFALI